MARLKISIVFESGARIGSGKAKLLRYVVSDTLSLQHHNDPMFLLRRTILTGGATLAAMAATGLARAGTAKFIVFAAASLKDVLDAIDTQWQRETGRHAVISYAASSTLAKQIEAGAPADLFISADLDWMDYVEQRNLLKAGTRSDLLGNSIVLIAPADSKISLSITPGFGLAAALGGGKLAMADPNAVPAGRYGKAALEKLGVWSAVAGQVAAAENVRAALLLVARGEAPLGIVYQTDAAVEKRVRIVASFPADSHPPIVYPMALTAGSSNPDAAAFAAYLRGPAARRLFEAQGFTVLDEAR